MICVHPAAVHNTKRIQELQDATGLTSYQVPGRTYAILAPNNVLIFAKPRKPISYRNPYNGGGNAA